MSKLIDVCGMPNFEVKTTDGKEYVLLPFKHLYDVPTVPAIPLDKVKQAREEIENIAWKTCTSRMVDGNRVRTELIDREDVLEILDKLIESEEK